MSPTYTEGSEPTWRYLSGALYLILIAVFLLWTWAGPISRISAGAGPTTDDGFVASLFLLGLLACTLAIRTLMKDGVPVRIEGGAVFFPKNGAWNVLLGQTVALSTTEIEKVEVLWPMKPLRGGGMAPYIYRIVVHTIDGRRYSKMYHPYGKKDQEWARSTASHIEAVLGPKLRHLDYRTRRPLHPGARAS